MPNKMTVNEFIKKTIGVKWVDRACTFDEMDCWGLVILYYRHVLETELKTITGYQSRETTIQSEAIPESLRNWEQCEKSNNAVFLAYIGSVPVHVGIVIDDHVLHAKGNTRQGGQVQYNRLDVIERIYSKIEYYKYANLS